MKTCLTGYVVRVVIGRAFLHLRYQWLLGRDGSRFPFFNKCILQAPNMRPSSKQVRTNLRTPTTHGDGHFCIHVPFYLNPACSAMYHGRPRKPVTKRTTKRNRLKANESEMHWDDVVSKAADPSLRQISHCSSCQVRAGYESLAWNEMVGSLKSAKLHSRRLGSQRLP